LFKFNYFLKIKYTARIKKQNPIKWFDLRVSFLKKTSVNPIKTVRVITSCMTFSCQRLKGPPFSLNPILLAGTWKAYSKRAIDQLINIILTNPRLLAHFIWLNFKCPYQANVIKVFESTKSPSVRIVLFMK